MLCSMPSISTVPPALFAPRLLNIKVSPRGSLRLKFSLQTSLAEVGVPPPPPPKAERPLNATRIEVNLSGDAQTGPSAGQSQSGGQSFGKGHGMSQQKKVKIGCPLHIFLSCFFSLFWLKEA